jgi:hypothetical protein
MIQDDEAMSVFTHSGPIAAYRKRLKMAVFCLSRRAETDPKRIYAGVISAGFWRSQ